MRRPFPLLFALCVPLVFLHADYQPSVSLGEATLYLSDVAVLAAGAIGLVVVLNMIAAFPAHSARRVRVGDALRSE